jgi:hypothetical protein
LKFSFKKKIPLDKNKKKTKLLDSSLNIHSLTENGNEKQNKNSTEEIEKVNNNNNISNNEKNLKDDSHTNNITEKIVNENEDKDIEGGKAESIFTCNGCKKKLDDEGKRPHWKWNFDRNLRFCEKCYKTKEDDYEKLINYCIICNSKLGFIRYNPKPKWKIKGQLCRKCWDNKNTK